jgi:integrase
MIRVTLINPADRKFFLAQWDDPVTGLTKSRSTQTTIRRDAERFAARLEDELNSGSYKPAVATLWSEARERYELESAPAKREKTRLKTQAMFNAVEKHFNPKLLQSVADPGFISRYQAELRSQGLKPYTIRGHLSDLRMFLGWCVQIEILAKMPTIKMPEVGEGMKGRPITGEEFERLLAGLSKVGTRAPGKDPSRLKPLLEEFIPGWIHFTRGLWLSGLRLEESMKLHWTSDRELGLDFTGRHPMMRIQGAHEKGKRFRLLPITPDFAEFLQQTPQKARHGFVFNPLTVGRGHLKGAYRPTHNHAGRIISAAGEAAGIRVSDSKFASAHDLRRAFGYRWSKLVMPKVLQELMRHESIQTTMEFYVGQMAEDAADAVWNAAARQSGNTFGNTSESNQSPSSKNIKK